jgi:hypothetical protein
MPPIEFALPDSFLFIPSNLGYLSFTIFLSFILSRIFNSKIVFFVSVILFLNIVYSDVFIKYGIKTYYSFFEFDKYIQSAPRNESGKIDSLSTIRIYNYPLKYSSTLSASVKDNLIEIHEPYIEKFIDISTFRFKFNKQIFSNERLFLNVYKYNNSFLDNSEQKARFIIDVTTSKTNFPSLYKKFTYKFIDTKTNKILANAFFIKFLYNNNNLRNRFLFWTRDKEKSLNISSFQNFDIVYKKLFIDKIGN